MEMVRNHLERSRKHTGVGPLPEQAPLSQALSMERTTCCPPDEVPGLGLFDAPEPQPPIHLHTGLPHEDKLSGGGFSSTGLYWHQSQGSRQE